MRKFSPLALSVTSLVALLSAAGCSSSDSGGGDDNLTPFVPGGAGTTGVGGAAVTGTGGTGNAVGAAGSPAEGQGGSALIGAGGSAVAAGGAAGTGAVTGQEVTAGPPPGGYFKSGGWNGYAFTATNVAGTTITPATFETLPAGQPFCVSPLGPWI